MTDRDDRHKQIPALGQPQDRADPLPEPDFAREHQETAVDIDVITDENEQEREPESPRGWSGMQR